jgi:Protein of unknown function (DUF1579)
MPVGPRSLAVSLLLLIALPALAEPPKLPAPGPETQKLAYFVGTWKTEGMVSENPFMPGGKMSSTDTCEWFDGKFAVVCKTRGQGPMGPSRGLGIMNWSPEEKVYLYFGVDNTPMAMSTVPRGTVDGDVWTYSDESRMNGKLVKSRYVMTRIDQRTYSFKWEIEGEGGAWSTVVTGKSTRVK